LTDSAGEFQRYQPAFHSSASRRDATGIVFYDFRSRNKIEVDAGAQAKDTASRYLENPPHCRIKANVMLLTAFFETIQGRRRI